MFETPMPRQKYRRRWSESTNTDPSPLRTGNWSNKNFKITTIILSKNISKHICNIYHSFLWHSNYSLAVSFLSGFLHMLCQFRFWFHGYSGNYTFNPWQSRSASHSGLHSFIPSCWYSIGHHSLNLLNHLHILRFSCSIPRRAVHSYLNMAHINSANFGTFTSEFHHNCATRN